MKPVIIAALAVLIVSVSILLTTTLTAQEVNATEEDLPFPVQSGGTGTEKAIPPWVKNNAIWWGEDKISDTEFLSALQFLINSGSLTVANSSEDVSELEEKLQSMRELKDKYQQAMIELKSENDKLRKENLLNLEGEQKSSASGNSIQELKNQAISWNYKDIIRNEDKYIGKIIFVEGSISNVDEREDVEDWVLLSVHTTDTGNGYWEDLMYIWYGNPSRLLYQDTIEAYIVVDEVNSRESSLLDGFYVYHPIGTARHVSCTSC